jgi:UDP-N-acetylmuramate dehydrogenase
MSLAKRLAPYGRIKENEPLSSHTTYRIGGPAAYYITPENGTGLMRIVEILNEEHVPWHVLGRGSNVLVDDRPFEGAILNLDATMNGFYFEPDGLVTAQAGCSLINLAVEAAKRGLSGLEFASGIPGSVGGGLYMNAGAYKSDLSSILTEVLVLRDGKMEWLPKDELEYSYRHSIFQRKKDWLVVAGRFQLTPGNEEDIQALMANRRARRMASQPLNMPCAGSVFRNPDNMAAWQLVDALGYRGCRQGGAMVSDLHSNFIVNAGGATFEDVAGLIDAIRQAAKEQFGVELIPEVERLVWAEEQND